jgi:hypothetical protein
MRVLSRLLLPFLDQLMVTQSVEDTTRDASRPGPLLTRIKERAGGRRREVLKPVVTVSDERLQVLGGALLDLMHDQGFAPEAFVAIANGGVKVVEAMPKHGALAVWSCRLQRSGTERMKQSGLCRKLLRRLPYPLTNLFRVFEDWLQGRKGVTVPPPPPTLADELGQISEEIGRRGIHRVAVIDDAADSGATLACVMGCLRDSLPDSVDLRSAVITATRAPERAAISPDFRLFDLTLLRFPWSLDYKGSHE